MAGPEVFINYRTGDGEEAAGAGGTSSLGPLRRGTRVQGAPLDSPRARHSPRPSLTDPVGA